MEILWGNLGVHNEEKEGEKKLKSLWFLVKYGKGNC